MVFMEFFNNWFSLLFPMGLFGMMMFAGEGGGGGEGETTTTTGGEGAGDETGDGDAETGDEDVQAETDKDGKKVVPLSVLMKTKAKLKQQYEELSRKHTAATAQIAQLADLEMQSPGTFRRRLEELGYKAPAQEINKIENKAEKIQDKLDDLKPGEKIPESLKKEIGELKGTINEIKKGLQYLYRQGVERDYNMTVKEIKQELSEDYSAKAQDLIQAAAEKLLARRQVKSEREAWNAAKKDYDDSYAETTKKRAKKSEDAESKRKGQPVDLSPDALSFLKEDVSKIDDKSKRKQKVEDGWDKIKNMKL